MSGQNTERNTGKLMPPWKPGESGNPGGRPKKSPVTDYVREQLESEIPEEMLAALKAPVRELFHLVYGPHPTFGQMIAFKLVQSAGKGDMFAMNSLLDRVEGKVTQKVSGEDGGPIQFTLTRAGKKEQ